MFKARLFGLLALVAVFAMLIPTSHAFAATRQALQSNDGTLYYTFNQSFNFSSASGTGNANGTSISLDPSIVQTAVTDQFKHTLFVADGSGNTTAYIYGSQVPVQASSNSDGSINISFTQSSNTVTASFSGTMANNQITANYQQQTIGGNTVGHQEYMGGTNIQASFTTAVTWVTADEIPAAPSNGQYQISSDGGVLLSWSPASSSNVAGYDVYRMIVGVNSVPLYVGTVQTTNASDESQEAQQHAQTATGIIYTIYAVGPTGVENPSDAIVYAESF